MARKLRSYLGAATRCLLLAAGETDELAIEVLGDLPPPLTVEMPRRATKPRGGQTVVRPTFRPSRQRLV